MANQKQSGISSVDPIYQTFSKDICTLLTHARRSAGRAVNAILTASHWEIGRRIVEFEQKGKKRAEYGSELLQRLFIDLTQKFGRGFSERNLRQIRLFDTLWHKSQTLSAEFIDSEKWQTLSAEFKIKNLAEYFPLPWSAYVLLLSVKNENICHFYESEALRGGWSVRQLSRQIPPHFYERTLLSRNKAAMLEKGGIPKKSDITSSEKEIKDPFVLEFLGLKDNFKLFFKKSAWYLWGSSMKKI